MFVAHADDVLSGQAAHAALALQAAASAQHFCWTQLLQLGRGSEKAPHVTEPHPGSVAQAVVHAPPHPHAIRLEYAIAPAALFVRHDATQEAVVHGDAHW